MTLTLLWTVLKSKYTWIAVVLIALGAYGTHWYAQQIDAANKAGYADAEKKLQPKIDAASAERDQAKADKKVYVDKYNKYVTDTEKAKSEQAKEQAALVGSLREKLADANKKYAALAAHPKEVIRYVSEKADAACAIPSGFVQLFNRTATEPTDDLGLTSGPTGDADAPSGVDLSAVAQAAAANNVDALQCHSKLNSWIDWYDGSKQIIDEVRQKVEISAPPSK